MTKLEYLSYLKSKKGLLIKDKYEDETRLSEVLPEDREDLLRNGYIFMDEVDSDTTWVEITNLGEDFLLSVY